MSRKNWETVAKYCCAKCRYTDKVGVTLSLETREKLRIKSTGRKHTEATKNKMRGKNCHLWRGGPKPKPDCLTCGTKLSRLDATKCKKCKIELMSMGGDKSPNWRGGKTSDNHRVRNSNEYKEWRNSVFKRDSYTCVHCGVCGGKLHADHIKPFSLFPDIRLDVNNGRTLCISCHKQTDTYMSKINSYKRELKSVAN